ncbi:MAG TPA: hypothetical protein VNT60_06130 [Deinococcales bacterium]|nr:hypothetical protein [Deinococcales bacterium]
MSRRAWTPTLRAGAAAAHGPGRAARRPARVRAAAAQAVFDHADADHARVERRTV